MLKKKKNPLTLLVSVSLSLHSQGGKDVSHHVPGQRGVPRSGMDELFLC